MSEAIVLPSRTELPGPRLTYKRIMATNPVLRTLLDDAGGACPTRPFIYNGTIYAAGDIVLVVNGFDETPSKKLPDAWIAILVDYSSQHPVRTHSIRAVHPRAKEKIEYVGLAWAFSVENIHDLVDLKIVGHNVLRPFDAKQDEEFNTIFLSKDHPPNLRFWSTEVEWFTVDNLLGLVPPADVGNGVASARPVTIPFTSNWMRLAVEVIPEEEEAYETALRAHPKIVPCWHALEVWSAPDIPLPDGFVPEDVPKDVEKE
ncbi:uncharacterized protein BXZ73DRAFT_79011 [Epithele typhae]|uniref:uncharacterized protein n=1 Tax=Epithele typhae TaxID=378194 RepID=UPI0020088381|nr:uncharacterized protein BXZ73DRAFT_104696 [Epithele typhae]XP_047875861.1 uncharacterized protein BXZ73DRAFT_79011 [Epithele typhae]KAH9920569.1 hypothetical protein BXZ73DRAFT_104696 [Epithele typhae]KAH9925340.1 hypothetical protein BXZ73DRAFT_79011 [Epithele typhae]